MPLAGLLGWLRWLFPVRCVNCGKFIEYTKCGMCSGCFRTIRPCLRLKGSLNYLLIYDRDIQRIMKKAKYRNSPRAFREMALYMGGELKKSGLPGGVVTWVPMRRSDLGRRGYNQSRIIAEALAREWELPCRGLLRKTRRNSRQAGLDMEQRRENVKNAYACTLENVPETVYVADDICTTGSTLHACKTALEQAGVKKVLFITLAHVPHYKKINDKKSKIMLAKK